ncbi:MAG TPA: TerB family tellurite resistance protein [Polyangia bacterium]|jgi:uncharacterized tellurite resistance protein B-like protein
MELRELNQDERLGLVALIEAVVRADHQVSEEEEGVLADVIEALGPEAYDAAVEKVDEELDGEEALKKFLQRITRPEARELIYGTVLELAISDVMTGSESTLLGWLADTWQIKTEFETQPDL